MKAWTAPARLLPVTVRPADGETIVSYARRLSEANELRPTEILRALGQLTNTTAGKHLLICDAWPNDLAIGRLETYTGIPRTRLARALPALRWKEAPSLKPLPADRPALYFRRTDPRARPGCRHCELAASGPDGPAVLRLPGWTPLICRRHRRWTGYAHETSQYDLSAAPDILAADRRRMRLLARSDDWQWTARIFQAAWNMTQDWTKADPRRMPVFSRRWRDRAAALGITVSTTDKWPPRVVTFPEAVTLTAILTDLNWRRYTALEWDIQPFYQHIARSIGEPSYSRWSVLNDPIGRWLRFHRNRFADVRKWAWRDPAPENRHFK